MCYFNDLQFQVRTWSNKPSQNAIRGGCLTEYSNISVLYATPQHLITAQPVISDSAQCTALPVSQKI